MQVSLIIPTYNEEKVIGDCLESLSMQSYKDFEIIVVDDGSSDNSKLKAQKSKPQLKNQNLKILEQEHKGAGAARNLGVGKAKGEILVFVDADMTFDKDFIKNLIAPILKGQSAGTFSKEEYLINKDNVWTRCWNINLGFPPDKMHKYGYPDRQKVFRAILKTEFEKAGGFDAKAGYIDDWSLSEKLGIEALAAPNAVFYHKNPDSLKEVFMQSKWMAKRKYKLGIFGGLGKAWLPINLMPKFIMFKVVFGVAATIGVLEYYLLGRTAK